MNKINKNIFFLIILIFIAYSCKSRNIYEKEILSSEKKETTEQENINKTINDEEFQLFWTEFRNSVINSDYINLKNFVLFPLEVKGYIDAYPVIKCDVEDFEFVLNYFLILHDEDRLNFIKECKDCIFEPHKDAVCMVDMLFKKVNSEWKLTEIYTDTPDLEEKIKEHRKDKKENVFMNSIVMEEFQLFWQNFRKNIITSNYKGLKELIEFPVIIEGFIWNYPIIKLSKEDFNFIFNLFLKNTDVACADNLKFIKDIENIENVLYLLNIQKDYIRIENMEFKKINSEWKLNLIYMDTKKMIEYVKEHRKKENIFMNTTVIEEFQLFWNEFRKNIITSDYGTLKKHIKFPLFLDGFFKIEINENDFIFVINSFLKENFYLRDSVLDNLNFIKNVDIMYDALVYSKNGIRMENMEFEKINSEWKLSIIYMNTYDLQEKIKDYNKVIKNEKKR